jgi:hyaluronan synthase
MALGTREANGSILIFIDSDTFLEEEAIYRLVQPFADPRVGAVAGHTNVIVEEDNFISKMEAVRYYVSQRIMKAAESIFNSVTCCPGPLSGYRKSAVLAVLDRWENQMFLGAKATFGDDRSLTNFILRNYRVVYHAGARCATFVPNKLGVLIRQQLRWKKSWLRELTVSGRFMWKKHPAAAISFYAAMIITLVSPIIAFGALFGLPFIGVSFNILGYISGLLLVYALLGVVFYYHTQSPYWYYGLYFALLYVAIFSFQNYYALITVRENKWGTR